MLIKVYVFNYKQFKFTLDKMRQKYDSKNNKNNVILSLFLFHFSNKNLNCLLFNK